MEDTWEKDLDLRLSKRPLEFFKIHMWFIELKNQKFWWRIPERKILWTWIVLSYLCVKLFIHLIPNMLIAENELNRFRIVINQSNNLFWVFLKQKQKHPITSKQKRYVQLIKTISSILMYLFQIQIHIQIIYYIKHS